MDRSKMDFLEKNHIVIASSGKKTGKSVFMFPGHGAQYGDMIKELAETYGIVGETLKVADEVYEQYEKRALTSCFWGNEDEQALLAMPSVMQPAIFACSMALYYLLKSEGIDADYYVGHSLGELAALCAAQGLDFKTGIKIAYFRGKMCEKIPAEMRGGMAVISAEYSKSLETEILEGIEGCQVSIVNSKKHFNISGNLLGIEKALMRCQEKGISAQKLDVTHAFHSNIMHPVVNPYMESIRDLKINMPEKPVFSTILGRFYQKEDFINGEIYEILASQLITPFNFRDILQELEKKHHVTGFIEVGPSNMLSKLVRATLDDPCVLYINERKKDSLETYQFFKACYDVYGFAGDGNIGDISKGILHVIARHTMYPERIITLSEEPFYSELAMTDRVFQEIVDELQKKYAKLGGKLTKETSLGAIYRWMNDESEASVKDELRKAPGQDTVLSEGADKELMLPEQPFEKIVQYLVDTFGLPKNIITSEAKISEICNMIKNSPKKEMAEEGTPVIQTKDNAFSKEEIKQEVLEIVQEKTGYPLEFLEDDLEFEADMGIDSVKQAEIFSKIMEKHPYEQENAGNIKDYNTIAKLVEFICERAENVVVKRAVVGSPSESKTTLSSDEVHDFVLTVIQEKTDYPREILEDDMDLEADLGIDSVKQADIFGRIREKYDFQLEQGESIKEFGTISKIVAYTLQKASEGCKASGQENTKPEGNGAGEICECQESKMSRRFTTVTVESPYIPEAGDTYSFQGKTVLLIADMFGGKISGAIEVELTKRGANVVCLAEMEGSAYTADFADDESLTETMQRIKQEYTIDCIVNCRSVGTPFHLDELEEDEWENLVTTNYNVALHTAKAIYGRFEENKSGTAYFAVTNIGGCLGYEHSDSGYNPIGAVTAGFLKGLERELRPFNCKLIDFTHIEDSEAIAKITVKEMECIESLVEVCYDNDNVRKRPYVIEKEIEKQERIPMEITKDDVIFVTGGSRGIVREFIDALCKNYNPRVVFTGRTELATNEEWMQMSEQEFEDFKTKFMIEEKEKRPDASILEINALYDRMKHARELSTSLKEFQHKGYQVEYIQCNVSDMLSIKEAVDYVVQKYGKITGIINGAGLPALGKVPKKPNVQSREVVRVKANSFFALEKACEFQKLKFFISIGSISGRFGMDGQVDYSAGADLIARLSCMKQQENSGCKYTVLGWSAWEEVGMATMEAVKKVQQEERGLEYISVPEGRQWFMEELVYGGDLPEVLFFGKLGQNYPLGQLKYYDCEEKLSLKFITEEGYVIDKVQFPLLDRVEAYTETDITASRKVTVSKDLHLKDHLVEQDKVFAGVMHIETCCELIKLHMLLNEKDKIYTNFEIKEFDFKKFIKIYEETELHVLAEVKKRTKDYLEYEVIIKSDFVNRKGVLLIKDQVHSCGTIVVYRKESAPAIRKYSDNIDEMIVKSRKIELHDFYEKAKKNIEFGPSFRCIHEAGYVSSMEYVGYVDVPDDSVHFSSSLQADTIIAPVAIDNIGRFMLFHQFREGYSVVPIKMDGITIYRKLRKGERIAVHCRYLEEDDKTVSFTCQSMDQEHNLVLDMKKVVLARINTYDNASH